MKTCPNCGAKMEELTDPPTLRICAVCKILQWERDGKTETRFGVLDISENHIGPLV